MKLMISIAATLLLVGGTALAAGPDSNSTGATGHSYKHAGMKNCSKEATAKGLKGEERTKFLKECHAAAKQNRDQNHS